MIRPANADDAAACRAIYEPYVVESAVSFEDTVPSVDEMAARIQAATVRHAWVVSEVNGAVVGYAYAIEHRGRRGYRFSAEVSVYVGSSSQRQGLGRRLYGSLFARLRELGYYNLYAGIVLPNPASLALHQALGFEPIGTFNRVGFKFGRWHDVSWWQLPLRSGEPPADEVAAIASKPGSGKRIVD